MFPILAVLFHRANDEDQLKVLRTVLIWQKTVSRFKQAITLWSSGMMKKVGTLIARRIFYNSAWFP